MRTTSVAGLLSALLLGFGLSAIGLARAADADTARPTAENPDPAATAARGADELYWAPTLEQAKEMAAATGRPIFLMGYSLVGDGSTYTKVGEEYCTGVY